MTDKINFNTDSVYSYKNWIKAFKINIDLVFWFTKFIKNIDSKLKLYFIYNQSKNTGCLVIDFFPGWKVNIIFFSQN